MLEHLIGHWRWGQGFWSFNLDTLLVSSILALLILGAAHRWGRSPSLTPSTRWEVLLDALASFAHNQCSALPTRSLRCFWGAFCMALGCWILTANLLSFIPPLLSSQVMSCLRMPGFAWVPTSDYNFTLALACFSTLMVQTLSWKLQGGHHFWMEKLSHPLPHWIFGFINLPLNLISELVSRSVSLSFRLFANMLIGDGGYLLIGTLAPFWLQWAPSFLWSTLHVLIVPLQAYIFLTITNVYGQMAVESSKHS